MQNDVNEYLNNLGLKVTTGDYANFNVNFDLSFFEFDQSKANEPQSNSTYNGNDIGNTFMKWDETYKNFYSQELPSGENATVGGITSNNTDIIMNIAHDTFMNRLHEIFHTLGLSHPKKKGAKKGIMAYPPNAPTTDDINDLINSNFLPIIIVK